MVQVLKPTRPKDQLTAISQALGIAKTLFGIDHDSRKLDILKQTADAKNKETVQNKAMSDPKSPESTLARQAARKLGYDISDQMTARQIQAALGKPDTTTKSNVRQDISSRRIRSREDIAGQKIRSQEKINIPKEARAQEAAARARIEETRKAKRFEQSNIEFENKQADRERKEKTRLYLAKHPFKRITKKMGGEQRKRLDSIRMARRGVNLMADAMASGDNTFTLLGDNQFTIGQHIFTEGLGRMQSGAVIGKEEAEQFIKFTPTKTNRKQEQAFKLREMARMIDQRVETFGISPGDIPDYISNSFEDDLRRIAQAKYKTRNPKEEAIKKQAEDLINETDFKIEDIDREIERQKKLKRKN